MIIEVDGQRYEVPDDASPDEIDQLTRPAKPVEAKPQLNMLERTGNAVLDNVSGAAELALNKGSQAFAFPAGLAAAAGAYLNPWERARNHSAVIPDEQQAIERATQARKNTESQYTYEPRTYGGKEYVRQADKVLGVVTKPLTWVGDKAGDVAEGAYRAAGQPAYEARAAGDVARTLIPFAAAEMGLRGARTGAQAVKGPLAEYAEKAAVRASNADRAALKRTFHRPLDEAALRETGRFMLDQKIPLRSP